MEANEARVQEEADNLQAILDAGEDMDNYDKDKHEKMKFLLRMYEAAGQYRVKPEDFI